jgi:thiamine biosynthesis protein ThiI
MDERAVLLRYHEIALKGANRAWFEERLLINTRKLLARALGPDARISLKKQQTRVLLETDRDGPALQEALTRVYGIESFSSIRKVETDRETIVRAAVEEFNAYLSSHPMPESFRVRTRRSEKVVVDDATDLDAQIGAAIQDLHPRLRVELRKPAFTLGIELRLPKTWIFTSRGEGPGGLPVGTNGKLLTLISGGLDSPVAAAQVLKRGSPTAFVHFYGAPFVGEDVLEKVEDLVRLVNRYQPEPQPLLVVPFGKIQEKIALGTHPKFRTILYRRMMLRIAEAMAHRLKALGLVTGESIGQVASQTIENMATINAAARMPVLRPLVTWDKQEIVDAAKRLGTYETSIRPGIDCCTLFADRHPAIRASTLAVEEQEKLLPMEELLQEALAGVLVRRPF